MTIYDERFFAENALVASAAARIILPQVIQEVQASSVIDVGCGSAAWAAVAKENGCSILGVDGHVMPEQLLIQESEFEKRDIANGVSCSGYDLAICLEVAEHLSVEAAVPLITGLCEATFVLFSAAHPGQRGINHINEQWSSYWAAIFADCGYVGSCDLRDRHWDDDSINFFYRENITLYSISENLERIGYAQEIRDTIHPRRP